MMRKLSWIFFALACVGVPLYAYWALEQDAAAQRAAHATACGLVAMAILFFSALMMAVFSVIAGLFGFLSFRSLKGPKSKRRILELVALFVPCLVGVAFIALLYLMP
jgi:hypothetical protein